MLFAVPLYNFGVSQHFKTWADLVITDPRMAAGVEPAIAGKPAVLVTVRGGSYAAGTPREGWDHATGWMRRILADVWQLDLKVVETEFTLVGVNPALDQFTALAADLRRQAEAEARSHGRALTGAAPAQAGSDRRLTVSARGRPVVRVLESPPAPETGRTHLRSSSPMACRSIGFET